MNLLRGQGPRLIHTPEISHATRGREPCPRGPEPLTVSLAGAEMGLNPQIVGTETKPYRMEYGWRDTVLYALGIGAKRDELDYLYEGRGPKVYPSFGVVPA